MTQRSEVIARTIAGATITAVALSCLALLISPKSRAVSTEPQPGGGSGGVLVQFTIDCTKAMHAIPDEIYGLANPTPTHLKELRLKLWRWGGNPSTRYNWEVGNAWNAARDWEFRNGNYSQTSAEARKPSGAADLAIIGARQFGASAYLTIPTMGWVARNDNQANQSIGVPAQSGDPVSSGSDAIPGYDPESNRQRVSVRSLPRKGGAFSDPPNRTDNAVYQDEWVAHLVKRFGKASSGGGGAVRWYAMDNEPDLWDGTHTDMHPVRPGYDDLLKQFLDYGNALKDVDPTAQIAGPVSWGWTGYFYSPKDRGSDNFSAHSDRKSHGDVPFLPWFLKSVADADKKSGRRSLDILDVHYYPQSDGVYGGKTDDKANALRLRSVRSLWDPNYLDESWINEKIALLPRLKEWVKANYPGTKIGLMEWNWGADTTMNGALAIADALGVFGREGLDLAAYWTCPGVGSPGYEAFRMFRNADGKGAGFGSGALAVTSGGGEEVSLYAAKDEKANVVTVMALNKNKSEQRETEIRLEGLKSGERRVAGFRYSVDNLKNIVSIPDNTMRSDGGLKLVLPPYSMTLLRISL